MPWSIIQPAEGCATNTGTDLMSDWIREQGRVVAVDGYQARVRIERQSTCGSCSARSGCGSGVLSEVLGRKAVEISIAHPGTLQPGDGVTLGIRDHALVAGAFMMYLVPLAGMVALPASLMVLAPVVGEGFHLLAAVLGLAAGLGSVRIWLRRRAPDMAPVLLEHQPAGQGPGTSAALMPSP